MRYLCIDPEWRSANCLSRNCKATDIAPLQAVMKALYDEYNWYEISREPYQPDYFTHLLCAPPLPPGGSLDRQQSQTIFDSRNRCLGWFELYDGYPDPDSLWIAALFLHPRDQGRGLGRELVSRLIDRVREKGKFQTIGLAVLLRNWPALQFWHRMGFDRITRVKANRYYGEDMKGTLSLEMRL